MEENKYRERERGERNLCMLFVYKNRILKERERMMERWLCFKLWYFDELFKI